MTETETTMEEREYWRVPHWHHEPVRFTPGDWSPKRTKVTMTGEIDGHEPWEYRETTSDLYVSYFDSPSIALIVTTVDSLIGMSFGATYPAEAVMTIRSIALARERYPEQLLAAENLLISADHKRLTWNSSKTLLDDIKRAISDVELKCT